jgi:signal transduction histidine kinase
MEAVRDYIDRRGITAMIDSVMESGLRAAQIVENMLSFSRKSESKMVPYDMGKLLDKTIELASNDYDLKKKYDFRCVEIDRRYDADVPKVPCEYSKIQQVFLNILKNGAQAMAECKAESLLPEKPTFFLRINKENRMVRVEIEDNGPGMDERTRKRVFEPFFTTKGVGTGTGLGLSVSYFIITENHKGTMAVESAPGKGTTFILRLPIKQGGKQ